mgnify:CR=1 FL=1|jgi:hypothetical protein
MAPPPAVLALAGAMLIFGTINTVATKLQDRTVIATDGEGRPVYFYAPAVQSLFM